MAARQQPIWARMWPSWQTVPNCAKTMLRSRWSCAESVSWVAARGCQRPARRHPHWGVSFGIQPRQVGCRSRLGWGQGVRLPNLLRTPHPPKSRKCGGGSLRIEARRRGCRNWPLGPHHGRTKAAWRWHPMPAALGRWPLASWLRRHARANEALKNARTYVSSKPVNGKMV